MKKFFKFKERKTSTKIEIISGLTTFLSMSYILFVNPDVLSNAGMDKSSVFVATALAAAIGTLIMGVLANYPLALAPGMGMNAFFTYSVVLTMGFDWQTALAAIFVSGILFLILSATGLRKIVINAIPISLKYAVGTGIGFFIAFIGLQNAGIIVNNDAVLVGLGDLHKTTTIISIVGLFITAVLYVKKVKGAIFIGIISCIFLGVLTKDISLPSQAVSTPPSLSTFGAIFEPLSNMKTFTVQFLIVVLTFLFVDFFDTAGTIIAVGQRAGLIDKKGEIQGSQKALLADSTATVIGSVLGTSSTTSFIESCTGVEEGGRTGFSSVIVAILFLLALFFSPFISIVTAYATAPALIIVGGLMVSSFGKIDWDDVSVTLSSFITVILMITTYSIADGMAAGFITYVALMVANKRGKEVHPIMYALSILFVLYFVYVK